MLRLPTVSVSVVALVALVAPAVPTSAAVPKDPQVAARASGSQLDVAAGRVGKAKVGMSVRRALRTKQFNHNVRYEVPGACSYTIELQPKGRWKKRYDVVTAKHRIVEMGVLSKKLRTTNGSGIGTPLSALRKRYGSRLSRPREAGYGQWAVFVRKGTGKNRKWLGFLLSTEAYSTIDPVASDRVTFMAVTRGKRPQLMRDGC